MHRVKKTVACIWIFLIVACLQKVVCAQGTDYTNSSTGYRAVIEDEAQLLSEEKRDALLQTMKDITNYGNVMFLSVDNNPGTTASLAKRSYLNEFGETSGTIFVIDMAQREIYIYSGDDAYRVITKAYANTITDNVYIYATKGQYYECASEAFREEITLFNDRKIAMPMKYLCNGFLAVLLALVVNFIVVISSSAKPETTALERMQSISRGIRISNPWKEVVKTFTRYSPASSGRGGGFRGGSGGGFSGGGGGHKF